ncbi:MAG: P-II family nitrogen regulator [Acetatifactor sp.]
MKELDMIVRADKLETIKKILVDEFQCGGMTVSNVLGCGGQKGFTEEYVGTRTHVNLLPKLNIRVVVKDGDADEIIDKLCDAIATGHYGDGKIFVKDVVDVVRVRTKERGEGAV